MHILMTAFTIFHIAAGFASIALAVRLLTPGERSQWRSKAALFVAQAICWVYPIAGFVAASQAWRAFQAGAHHAFPIMLAPIAWLLVMGVVFAVVDFAEDGILGNTRKSGG